jgi:hypothetical protein
MNNVPTKMVVTSYSGAIRRLLIIASRNHFSGPLACASTSSILRFSTTPQNLLSTPRTKTGTSASPTKRVAATKKTALSPAKQGPVAKDNKKTNSKSARVTAKKTTKSTKGKKIVSKSKTDATAGRPRKRRPLTPDEKDITERRKLKKCLLVTPTLAPIRPWNIFCSQEMKGGHFKVTDIIQGLATKFKSLDTIEIEKLKEQSLKNKTANDVAVKNWIEQHSVKDIKAHNHALSRLAHKWGYNSSEMKIDDHRVPKRPGGPFGFYISSRWASGDFSGVSATEAGSRMGIEWKSLTDSQKKPFQDLAEAAHARWLKDIAKISS